MTRKIHLEESFQDKPRPPCSASLASLLPLRPDNLLGLLTVFLFGRDTLPASVSLRPLSCAQLPGQSLVFPSPALTSSPGLPVADGIHPGELLSRQQRSALYGRS